jgi:hypothetical protein
MSQPTNPLPGEPPDGPPHRRHPSPLRRLSDRFSVLAPSGRTSRMLLIFPLLAAVFYVAVWLFLLPGSPSGYELFGVAIGLYNLLPALALTALISSSSRHLAKGIPVVAAGSLVFTAIAVYVPFSILTSDSSTAVLGFLYLPLVLGTVVVVTCLLALLLHTLRSRHEHRGVAPSL